MHPPPCSGGRRVPERSKACIGLLVSAGAVLPRYGYWCHAGLTAANRHLSCKVPRCIRTCLGLRVPTDTMWPRCKYWCHVGPWATGKHRGRAMQLEHAPPDWQMSVSPRNYSLRGSSPRPMAHKIIALTTELRELCLSSGCMPALARHKPVVYDGTCRRRITSLPPRPGSLSG